MRDKKRVKFIFVVISWVLLLFLAGCSSLAQSEKFPYPELEKDIMEEAEQKFSHKGAGEINELNEEKTQAQSGIEGSSKTEIDESIDEEEQISSNGNLFSDTKPDAKGRSLRTNFFGGRLIRETITENDTEIVRIVFDGGAVIKHNKVEIAASKIVLDGGNIGKCTGGVKITDKNSGIRIQSSRADYARDEQKIILTGEPRMFVKRGNTENPVLVMARKIQRNIADGETIFEGDVRIIHEKQTLLAEKGIYSDKEERIELPDNPVIFSHGRFLSGKTLYYYPSSKKTLFDKEVILLSRAGGLGLELGSSRGSETPDLESFARSGGYREARRPDSEKSETQKGEEEISILSSDSLEYLILAESESTIHLKGNVMLTNRELNLKSPLLQLEGKEFENIYAREGVDILERQQNIHVEAGFMRYEKETGKIRLEKEPRMEFLNKDDGEVSATLSGNIIERDSSSGLITARGDVKITREDFEAVGEEAVFNERSRVIVMEGDSGIQEGRNRIKSEKVMIFPDSNRILLLNRITGYVIEE